MTRRAARDIKSPTGRIVVSKGETVQAAPSKRLPGCWKLRTVVDGTPRVYVVPADALEPLDDIDLPAPEAVSPRCLTVPDDLIDTSVPWPVVVVTAGVFFGALGWALVGG